MSLCENLTSQLDNQFKAFFLKKAETLTELQELDKQKQTETLSVPDYEL